MSFFRFSLMVDVSQSENANMGLCSSGVRLGWRLAF
jgi:hypothetical protein